MPNTTSTVSPDLAAFMPTTSNGGISDGGRTVTVHIRPNVHFSPPVDRAVTSADIAYAIERGANPNVVTRILRRTSGRTRPLPSRAHDAPRAIWAALDREAIAQADGGPLFATPATHFIYPGVVGYELAGGAAGTRMDYNGSLRVAEKYMKLAPSR